MSELFDQHSADLLRFTVGRVNDQQVAIDIVGETFALALRRRNRFKGQSLEDARGWLYGIAKNLIFEFCYCDFLEWFKWKHKL